MSDPSNIQMNRKPTQPELNENASMPDVPPIDTTHDIITVVRDPNNPLGKRFELNDDGSIAKSANVKLSLGFATQHHVPTASNLKALLEEVGKDPSAAIILSYFPGIPVGEEFMIFSAKRMSKSLDVSIDDREQLKGIHAIDFDGRSMKRVCRLKENVAPSSWVLIDRDVDNQTPDEIANFSQDEFLAALDNLLPGIKSTTLVLSPSSSSRVLKNNEPVSQGNGHMFVRISDPCDLERLVKFIIPRAIERELAWVKLKFSRTNPDQVAAKSWAMIIDHSVWNVGRLVFCGKPTVRGGLSVLPPSIEIRLGLSAAIDTAKIETPDIPKVQKLTREAGAELSISSSNGNLTVAANDLALDTELDAQGFGLVTVRHLLKRNVKHKIRCQAPFRESDSWAAFYNVNSKGLPFVHDSGTNITHWLDPSDEVEVSGIRANAVVEQLLIDVKADDALTLEPEAIKALAYIKHMDPAEYRRKRGQLKRANNKVPLAEIDRAVKSYLSDGGPSTHHGYATALLETLTVGEWSPVVHNGTLHVVDTETNLWLPVPFEKLQKDVATEFDGLENCTRGGDYKAISSHAMSLAERTGFFDEAPPGIACPAGFYQVQNGKITLVPMTPEHRQRFSIDVTPSDEPTPGFDAFLYETFASEDAGEDQQRGLLQEVFGAILLGLVPRFQKAVVFYDPFGRAGKGTVERILRQLVPSTYVTAVSPFSWDSDYHVATLATSRLNVVGELPDDKPIPAAIFKSVLGGDLVTGRHPTHRPFTFKNEAAHLFMSNHFINTRDHSEAFFARWLLIEFPNSLLRSGKPIDVGLADRIIETEMTGIANWALEGAARLLKQGKFSESIVHHRLMGEWRRNRNSIEQFIYERCKLSPDAKTKRSDFYVAYTEWCGDSGKKPFSKARVKDILEHNAGMNIRLSRPNGIETFNGIELMPEEFEPLVG